MGSREVPARVARKDRARRDVVLPLNDGVTTALRAYADRGVFRGFRATPLSRGRVEYGFQWLFRAEMRAAFDVRRATLTFAALVPGIGRRSPMAAALDALVASRTGRDQPAHKRVDGRRARVTSGSRRGSWSLQVRIRGANHQYAVQRVLNLVNEVFLCLREAYPEYLIERFGLPAE